MSKSMPKTIKDLSQLLQDDIECCVEAYLDDYIGRKALGDLIILLQQIVVDRIKEHENGN